jgi:hypothetical protein
MDTCPLHLPIDDDMPDMDISIQAHCPTGGVEVNDDMAANDFDIDRPWIPGHSAPDIDHEYDPRCRPIDDTLQSSMLMQVSPGYYRIACYRHENVAIATSKLPSEDNTPMMGLFCNGDGQTTPASSRGDVQRNARLPTCKKVCFEMDSIICRYSVVRYPKEVLKTTFLDNNNYVWCNNNETIVIDASALTSGHGGRANDALDDKKNNATIVWRNGQSCLVALREICFYEEICVAYGWPFWRTYPNLQLRERARRYYESIQAEKDQQDKVRQLVKKRKFQETHGNRAVRDTARIDVTPIADAQELPRNKYKRRNRIDCFFSVVGSEEKDVEMSDVNVAYENSDVLNDVIVCDPIIPRARTAHDIASHMG